MRALVVAALLATGCRSLLGIDDEPRVIGTDAAASADADSLDAAPDAPPDAAPARFCRADYRVVPNAGTASTYRKPNGAASWLSARNQCDNDRAHLWIPETAQEAQAVFAAMPPELASQYLWIGVSDLEADGAWTTVLGAPFVPSFAPGQPNGGERYMLVDAQGLHYDWEGTQQELVCECPP